jgi:hypothetical protein
MMARIVGGALVALACGALGCATKPVAFSANAVESPIRADRGQRAVDSALELRFELVNESGRLQAISTWSPAIHIESVTRNGRPVEPEIFEPRLADDPLPQRRDTLPVLEADGLVAFFEQHGLSDLSLAGDHWQQRVFPLVKGRYRVVFSYHYDGPDYDRPNVFHGRIVAPPIKFKVE